MQSKHKPVPEHVHFFTFAGREKVKYGESLRAVCACGRTRVTAILEGPPGLAVKPAVKPTKHSTQKKA